MSESVSSQDNTNTLNAIPEGKPKSGRTWKKKQVYRTSSQNRKGVLSHLCKTYEQRKAEREKLLSLKTYEKELKEQTKQKKIERRVRREDNQKRRMANELKSAVYQQVILPIFFFFYSIYSLNFSIFF